jgi:hypothetical protein
VVGHRALLEVDGLDLAEEHGCVGLLGEDLACRRGDPALGEDAGRHLVEQRLEEVVGGPGDHGDVDVCAAKCLGRKKPAEARTDHDDLVAAGCVFFSHVRHNPYVPCSSPSSTTHRRQFGHRNCVPGPP